MESVLTYIIQVNLLLGLLFLGYHYLLKNLTFYRLNRIYFLVGSLYAFVYPFLNFKDWFSEKVSIPQGLVLEYIPFVIESDESKFSINDLVVYIASLGALYFLFKLIIQLFSLARIHWYSKPSQWREFLFRNVIFPITPFSFFNKVYLHKEQHQELELNDIFKHEYVHVRGHHSIDVLWFEIVLLICWYNPFVWLMRKSVRQNLEFLTDQQVLDKGVDRQAYQYSLLNVTKQGAQVGISNQFNFKTLKKRIMMMNKKRSSKLELSKYVFLLPILIITGITFSVNQAEAKIEIVVINMENTDLKQQIKEVFVQKQVDSTKPQQKKDEIIKVKIQNVKADSSDLDSIRTINIKEYADYVGAGVPSENGQRAPKSVNMVRLSSIDNLNQPLIILDGERMPEKFRLDALKPELIESFSVLNGKDAEKYGKGSENGVLVIDLKKESMDSKLKNLSEVGEVVVTGRKIEDKTRGKVVGITFKKDSLKEKSRLNPVVDIKAIPENAEYYIDDQKVSANDFKKVNPNKIESVVVRKDNETPLVKINTIKFVEENKTTDPQVFIPQKNELIVIDGKPSAMKEFKKLKKEEIESMSKIDNEGSRAIYGPKAKNGVVLITTKKK
ncbi:M56 family metallopeptidase [Sphingobacterium daejeonense]|uniref:M56 family metallopeptidase n=1 Tax=Sphingobacterium daejeonense TaxID=371142 RepID=A0ABW3RPF9_9SPHI